LTKRAECAAIISSVRALGVGLNMLTVAEGVETDSSSTSCARRASTWRKATCWAPRAAV
jgi:predicted signal transduction protein with EAL and GGDEF domain